MIEIQVKVGVLIIEGERLLLIREWSNKKEEYFWNIVKGTYGDVAGETLEECALRECKEETGYQVVLKSLLHCAVVASNKTRIQFNFMGVPVGEAEAQSVKDQKERGEDIQEVRWFSREEVKSMKAEDFINQRAYEATRGWLGGETYPLASIHSIKESS
jgi:ADP-ribose pyrophosphatase YjhB (NUDIX family)